jgi:membrane protease YdiL (CAAX protease family)
MGMAFGIFMVLSLIGTFVLSNITGIGLLQLSDPAKWDMNNPKMMIFIRGVLILQFLGLFLIPTLLFGYFSDPHPFRYLGLKAPSKSSYWLLAVGIMLVAIPAVEFTGLLNRNMHVSPRMRNWMEGMEKQAQGTILFMLNEHSPANLVKNLVFIALFAGIGEELFFRGVLQRLFIRACKNHWMGIVIAAFLFSFLHFQFLGFVPRFLLGILLGAIYWYSGSIWPAILAHFFYDGLFIVLAYLHPELATDENATILSPTATAITALFSVLLLIVLIRFMQRNSTTRYDEVFAGDKPELQDQDFTF